MAAAVTDATPLVRALTDPASTQALDGDGWTSLIALARAEQMAGTLAERLAGLPMPASVARLLAATRASAAHGRVQALWEAEMARRVLAPLGVPVVLLKGTAYAAAGLSPATGRSIGDLDILVPRAALDVVEAAVLAAGWEWVKPEPYDDAYYRRWMHELPPLIHRERDRMIDIHHTVLPPTTRITPQADAMIADSVVLENGLRVLSREDMVLHAVAHLFADGDLAGGLRNLWDIHCLLDEFDDEGFAARLQARARLHGLGAALARALRLRDAIYRGGPLQGPTDNLYRRRLLARDGWGRATRSGTRLAFYVRSHWLRMPPHLLARHLWTKWRKGGPGPG